MPLFTLSNQDFTDGRSGTTRRRSKGANDGGLEDRLLTRAAQNGAHVFVTHLQSRDREEAVASDPCSEMSACPWGRAPSGEPMSSAYLERRSVRGAGKASLGLRPRATGDTTGPFGGSER